MSTKDPVKKQKRPDMAIYTPRGRRSQDEVRRSPDNVSQSQPSKAAPTKDQSPPEPRSTSHCDMIDPEKNRKPPEQSKSRHRPSRITAETRRELPEESSRHLASRVFERSRDYSEESSQHRTSRQPAEKSREHSDEPRQYRARGPPADRGRRLSEDSGRTAVTSHSKARSTLTVTSAAIANGHGPPKTAGRPPEPPRSPSAPGEREPRRPPVASTPDPDEREPRRPPVASTPDPDEREPRRPPVASAPGPGEPAVDLTVKPVDLPTEPADGGQGAADGGEGRRRAASPSATQRHRDASPGGSRRRPRGPTGVYVPRAARRHCDSTGEPPSPDDRPQSSVAAAPARQQHGVTLEGRPGKAESSAGPDPPPSGAAAGHRRRDSDRATGRGDGERRRPASPQTEAREEKREAARKELPPAAAADAPSARDASVRKCAGRAVANGQDRELPPPPVSRPRAAERPAGRVERQRAVSPPHTDLAALVLEEAARHPAVLAARRGARTDPAESAAPPSGLLYVPGGPHSDPPEPPPSYSHPHSRPHGHAPSRHLFDPNNPGQALEVTPRASDCRERRPQDASRSYFEPYSGAAVPAGWSDPFSQPSNATNANRISQLLGRAVGEIEYMIASNRLLGSWALISRIRAHVQTECARLLVTDLRTWMTLGIDQTIWRSLYYAVIEELRSIELADQQWMLPEIIDDGMDFFASLVTALQQTYDIPVEQLSSLLFDPEMMRRKRYFSSVAALSQRLLLCLGDLTRYQHQLGRLPNLVQAHSFYLQAQQMNPKNGRPFNQLAILALYGHRRLDCVYLYARALMAANPFHTAKESLLSLFHESSRRYAARSPMPGQVAPPSAEQRTERGADLRTETWVHPGRGDRLQRTLRPERDGAADQSELRRAADADLLKDFTTTYLHVQGKLYTRVSLETYQEDAGVMLRQLSELLSREPMPLKSADMLHILGINMFNIANTKLKDERLGSELRSTYQELALAVAIEMAGHVIQRACQLLAKCPLDGGKATDRLFVPYALETCMVFVKVWCDWLLSSSAIWNPPPCTADYRVAGVADCWASLAELTNLLRLRENEDTVSLPSHRLNSVSSGEPTELVVRLPEDFCLQSFSPLLCGEHATRFVDPDVCSLERARDLLRMRGVLFVTEQFLCGTEPAPLRLLKTADGACRYVSQVSSHAPAEETAETGQRPSSPDVEVEWTREEEEERRRRTAQLPPLPASDASRPELARLQQQKVALERRARRQEEHSRRVEAIATAAHDSVTLEVRPRYLVADTNCYVDYLEQLESLISQHGAYTLTVPVTVLAELDGLSRPGGGGRPRPGQSDEHVQQVRRTARAALDFVRQRGAPHVRCATSRGHLLSSAVFTAEDDDDEQATNDDRILSCCRNLERGVAQQQPDGSQRLTREVVLLTDDRNLRLKAFSLDVPTRTVPDFLAWAA